MATEQEDTMTRLLVTSALVGSLFAGGAWAQDATAPDQAPDAAAVADDAAPELIRRNQDDSELRVDWISGSTVTSPMGETIGQVEDLIMDQESNEITAAIIAVGGFLGFGAKQIAVEWQELQVDHDAEEITLDLTREEAEEAPAYAFRDRERPPAPAAPATDTGTGTGMGGQTGGGMATPPPQ